MGEELIGKQVRTFDSVLARNCVSFLPYFFRQNIKKNQFSTLSFDFFFFFRGPGCERITFQSFTCLEVCLRSLGDFSSKLNFDINQKYSDCVKCNLKFPLRINVYTLECLVISLSPLGYLHTLLLNLSGKYFTLQVYRLLVSFTLIK